MILALLATVALADELVMVAARDLYQGVELTEEDIYAVEVTGHSDRLPADAFRDPAEVVGRVPVERILANEVIRAERLADPESATRMSAILPRGMRALQILSSDADRVPFGSWVDVLGDGCTVLQAAFVLASPSGPFEHAPLASGHIVLLVLPQQAERLVWAARSGPLALALRNDADVALDETVPQCPDPPNAEAARSPP